MIEGQILREEYLLDFHQNQISNENESDKKLWKQVMQQIQKEKNQNYEFQFLTINIGRGAKESLKRLVEEENLNVVRYHSDRQMIENKLIEFNIQHYQKAH